MAAKEEKSAPVAVYVAPKERSQLVKLDGTDQPVESNSLLYEDEFKGTYGGSAMPANWTGANDVQIMQPPVLPKTLQALVHQNNTLSQCCDAMVTNVHETGYELGLKDPPTTKAGEEPAKDPKVAAVEGFFDEVWPGLSFLQLRKKMGQDKERTGNAYWEVLRTARGEMVMLRPLDVKLTRMVIMSKPYDVEVSVKRGGVDVKLRVSMRYRRFVQSIGTTFVFYKEYGCPLLINKKTGELFENTPENRIKLLRARCLGTEVLHFMGMEDVDTPYGVPKWYPQMPSVLGSRKAEEHNLEYFEAGGVPPLMIFVQGGVMGATMKTALEEFLSSKPGAKQGAPVFEIASTGGEIGGANPGAKVLVERFGTERQKDSMFESYDEKCEARIRRAWRLPPIFVGKSDDYNLATAQASYAVAEAQVFKPERDEFDEKMNKTILRELDPTGSVVIRSKGLPVKDVNQQIIALNAAFAAGALDVEHYVEQLNEVVSLAMKVRAGAKEDQQAGFDQKREMGAALIEVAKRPPPTAGTTPKAKGTGSKSGPSDSSKKPAAVKKGEGLAQELVQALYAEAGAQLQSVLNQVLGLSPEEMYFFKAELASDELRDWLVEGPPQED